MITLNKGKAKEQWFKYDEDVSFLIRPFPFSGRSLSTGEANISEMLVAQASYCVIDWKGINDEKDKPVKCNDENKKFLFDYSNELFNFVCEKNIELNNKLINISQKKT